MHHQRDDEGLPTPCCARASAGARISSSGGAELRAAAAAEAGADAGAVSPLAAVRLLSDELMMPAHQRHQQQQQPQQQPPRPRPAAAFSTLANARGGAVEDAFALADDLLLPPPPLHDGSAAPRPPPPPPLCHFFGVYDGHGGGAAASHCAQRMHRLIGARLRRALSGGGGGGGAGGSGGGAALSDGVVVGAALKEAFLAADAELKAAAPLGPCGGSGNVGSGSGTTGLAASTPAPLVTAASAAGDSGSTAVVALLSPSHIWLAWAGDSRAVLVRAGAAAAATRDHRPGERADEASRVEAAGGLILNNGGPRLMGMLATTRAIGDHDLQAYGLTPEPEVMALPRGPDDEFLVSGAMVAVVVRWGWWWLAVIVRLVLEWFSDPTPTTHRPRFSAC